MFADVHSQRTYLDHGYAITIHKAQGATYDVALFYGDEHLCAED